MANLRLWEELMEIFIVEDDLVLRDELGKLLSSYGYKCSETDDFENIIEIIIEKEPDLVLLDINLPYFDGYHICRELRKKSDVPIIIMTSRNTEMDELMGINLGADDFVTKPFNKQILLARISSILKRSQKRNNNSNEIKYRGITLFPMKSEVSYNGKTIELTKNELKILSVLINNSDRIVSRDELMDELWQSDEFVDDNTLTVNVNRLRHDLESIGVNDFINTKRGQGYVV